VNAPVDEFRDSCSEVACICRFGVLILVLVGFFFFFFFFSPHLLLLGNTFGRNGSCVIVGVSSAAVMRPLQRQSTRLCKKEAVGSEGRYTYFIYYYLSYVRTCGFGMSSAFEGCFQYSRKSLRYHDACLWAQFKAQHSLSDFNANNYYICKAME
jgi:hypothetical protein